MSPDAEASYSYFRERARDFPKLQANAEAVIALKPDLIVRTYGGGPNALAFFERLGVPVLQIPYAVDFEGVRHAMRVTADALDRRASAETVTIQMDTRLANARNAARAPLRHLYMTPGGVTSGPGSFIHEIFLAAGHKNYEQRPGWRALPLERLARQAPDRTAVAFFDSKDHATDAWTAARHPLARALLQTDAVAEIDSAFLACTAWFAVNAVEALALAHNTSAAP
ncbi:MAG: ABC transporter substrate-binding protein [Pseudomonadota bacterium]